MEPAGFVQPVFLCPGRCLLGRRSRRCARSGGTRGTLRLRELFLELLHHRRELALAALLNFFAQRAIDPPPFFDVTLLELRPPLGFELQPGFPEGILRVLP